MNIPGDALKIMKLSNQERSAELAKDIGKLDQLRRLSSSVLVRKQYTKLMNALEWHMKQEEKA